MLFRRPRRRYGRLAMTTASQDFEPEFLKMLPTKQPLTSAAGLGTLLEAFNESALRKPFAEALPERTSPRSQGAYRLGLIQMASFLRGHDCLADLEEFRNDPMLFEAMKGETAAPRTMGDFLRDFEAENFQAHERVPGGAGAGLSRAAPSRPQKAV